MIDVDCNIGGEKLLSPVRGAVRFALEGHWSADDRRRYHRLFGENICFDVAKTVLVFDAKVLSIPLPDAIPALHELIEREVDAPSRWFVEDLAP